MNQYALLLTAQWSKRSCFQTKDGLIIKRNVKEFGDATAYNDKIESLNQIAQLNLSLNQSIELNQSLNL